MLTSHYKLPALYVDGQTPYAGADIEHLHLIVDAQSVGALRALRDSVFAVPDASSFEVKAQGGNSVSIAAGAAIISHEAVPCWVRTQAPASLLFPGDAVAPLFLRVAFYAGEDGRDDSFETALPEFLWEQQETDNGAVTLAKVTREGGALVVEDRRVFDVQVRVARIESDLGYDDDARGKGTVNERLAAVEAPVDPANPDAGITPAAFLSLKNRVDQLILELAELKDKTNEGAVITIRETPSNLIINSGKIIAELSHLNPTNGRQFIAGIDMPGKTGDAQDWNGVDAPVVRVGGNAIYDEENEVIRS